LNQVEVVQQADPGNTHKNVEPAEAEAENVILREQFHEYDPLLVSVQR
jgi:hypothetical protein